MNDAKVCLILHLRQILIIGDVVYLPVDIESANILDTILKALEKEQTQLIFMQT